MGKDILRGLKEAAMSRDEERLQFRTQQFTEHIGGIARIGRWRQIACKACRKTVPLHK